MKKIDLLKYEDYFLVTFTSVKDGLVVHDIRFTKDEILSGILKESLLEFITKLGDSKTQKYPFVYILGEPCHIFINGVIIEDIEEELGITNKDINDDDYLPF